MRKAQKNTQDKLFWANLYFTIIILFTANIPKFFNWQHHGTEELAHLEMVGTIVHQLTEGASIEEIEKAGLAPYYTDHGLDVYPSSAAGVPFTAA